jgi:uncharacterized repeat protein (TIGR04138 family)
MSQELSSIIETISDKDLRYHEDAYFFVMEALSFTQRKYSRVRHVSGVELLEGIKDLLLDKFGPLTLAVLKHWGIKSTVDFGHIVFNLVENRVLSKTEEDNIESFRNGYNFEEVFDRGYRKMLAKKISRMRTM